MKLRDLPSQNTQSLLADVVLSACLPIHTNTERFTGAACAVMLMRDLIQNVSVFQNLDVGYMFMFNTEGKIYVNILNGGVFQGSCN